MFSRFFPINYVDIPILLHQEVIGKKASLNFL